MSYLLLCFLVGLGSVATPAALFVGLGWLIHKKTGEEWAVCILAAMGYTMLAIFFAIFFAICGWGILGGK